MASYQYVYHMDNVSKAYPGSGKKVFENIRLNFLPGVKIGVVGVNGTGKSTLLKMMAGMDKEWTGEAWVAEGARVGYLPQEPKLDETLTVRENVMLGVAPPVSYTHLDVYKRQVYHSAITSGRRVRRSGRKICLSTNSPTPSSADCLISSSL